MPWLVPKVRASLLHDDIGRNQEEQVCLTLRNAVGSRREYAAVHVHEPPGGSERSRMSGHEALWAPTRRTEHSTRSIPTWCGFYEPRHDLGDVLVVQGYLHAVTCSPTDSTETYTRTSCLLPGSIAYQAVISAPVESSNSFSW